MRVQYVLSEIFTGLRRNLTMTIAVIITVAISTSLLGTGLLLRAQAQQTAGFWYDKVEITVYMCNGYLTGGQCAGEPVTETERQVILDTLETNPQVDEVFYETQEQAYENFREQMGDSLADAVTPDQLQESYRVALVDPEEFDSVTSAVSGLPGVQSVVDQREVLDGLFRVLNGFQLAAILVAVLQLVAAILLIGNTIRLAAFNRRRETGIMRLVGASNFYIQLPFILEAVLAGLLGALLGCLAVAGLVRLVVERLLVPNFPFTPWVDMGDVVSIVPWLLLTGVAISAIAAFITLRRYLRV